MTGKRRKSRTDWAKADAHKITPEEYAEMPEWTDGQIERAEIAVGGQVIRPAAGTLTKRGRPRSEAPKQTRIDQVLRKAARLPARNR
jgi:hypothetical protein